ncbi:MAG TPA: TIGR02466 family protein [Allosphingosinicella sp.]|nr:TIGR02466 family protein [Allosphingosinicella sp.]
MEIDTDALFERVTIEEAFWTPIVLCNITQDEVDRAALERAILARREAEEGRLVRSNRGGWHSETDLMEWGGDSAARLAEHVQRLANELTIDRKSPEEASFPWKLYGWANVNEKGSYNERHCHPGAFWSAIFYVRVDPSAGGGEIVFRDPRAPVNEMYAPRLGIRYNGGEGSIHIKPEAGMLILVPAWLEHSVRKWEGSEPRISVAMNLALR